MRAFGASRKPARLPRRAQPDVIRIKLSPRARSESLPGSKRMHGTIERAESNRLDAAREHARSLPLSDLNPAQPELFRTDTHWPYFDRLRKEDPVHYCKDSMFGPYWSVTRYNDIMAVDTTHQVFSSAASLGGITIRDV